MSGGKRKTKTTDAAAPLDDPWFEEDVDPGPGFDPSKPIETENARRERKERGAIPKVVL